MAVDQLSTVTFRQADTLELLPEGDKHLPAVSSGCSLTLVKMVPSRKGIKSWEYEWDDPRPSRPYWDLFTDFKPDEKIPILGPLSIRSMA